MLSQNPLTTWTKKVQNVAINSLVGENEEDIDGDVYMTEKRYMGQHPKVQKKE